ncbi:MAG: ABC transporter ATP-binding protein, partial [Acidimicrobiales bacterium]
MTVIETRGLTQRFGATVALDDLDVTVPRGVTGLVGANGAGKTTLMSIVLGLREATAGELTVLGLDPVRQGARLRAVVGYAPERNVLPDDMRAVDFVRHLAEVKGLPRDDARNRASDSLWLVGLGEERFRPLGTMSTGQRQRVKLAQALAADPSLILLDEPTDGLDPVQRDEMLGLIRRVNDDFGIDVLLSSHLLEEVERVCDHVVALDAGRLVASGPLSDLVGSEEGIELELVDLADAPTAVDDVERILVAAGVSVRHDGVSLVLTGHGPDQLLDEARDAVAAVGARLRSLRSRRRTLEDLFSESEVP